MAYWKWIGVVSIVLWSAGLMVSANLHAETAGYTLEDVKLHSAGALVDLCTVDPGHEHHDAALAFCYGFFEGAIRYAEAIANAKGHKHLVCAPAGTTRRQAVEVFTGYMKENPQYLNEGPVDAIYRALMPKWPCPQ